MRDGDLTYEHWRDSDKPLAIAIVAIVKFDASGKIIHEHIYWDQASVLVQLGLLDSSGLPVVGAEGVQWLVELAGE